MKWGSFLTPSLQFPSVTFIQSRTVSERRNPGVIATAVIRRRPASSNSLESPYASLITETLTRS